MTDGWRFYVNSKVLSVANDALLCKLCKKACSFFSSEVNDVGVMSPDEPVKEYALYVPPHGKRKLEMCSGHPGRF